MVTSFVGKIPESADISEFESRVSTLENKVNQIENDSILKDTEIVTRNQTWNYAGQPSTSGEAQIQINLSKDKAQYRKIVIVIPSMSYAKRNTSNVLENEFQVEEQRITVVKNSQAVYTSMKVTANRDSVTDYYVKSERINYTNSYSYVASVSSHNLTYYQGYLLTACYVQSYTRFNFNVTIEYY